MIYLFKNRTQGFDLAQCLFPELEQTFKHALTRELTYNSVLIKWRKKIHGQIGKAIEELYATRLEELYEMLTYHYSKSTNYEKAYHYFKKSGKKAIKYYATQEAMIFYKQTIQALEQQPVPEENKRKLHFVALYTRFPFLNR